MCCSVRRSHNRGVQFKSIRLTLVRIFLGDRALSCSGKRIMKKQNVALFLVGMLILHICWPVQCQVGKRCTQNSDCLEGSYCSKCSVPSTCHRQTTTNITTRSLPFNKYAWLTTHNSFAITSERLRFHVARVSAANQDDSVTHQLNNGVRGLMLDMYDFKNGIWLCHSFGGACYETTAFRPASETLNEVELFMSSNPSAIITIFIEDYVHTKNGLTDLFAQSQLMKYWFPASKMPKYGGDWPTIDTMVKNNERLVVFTSNRTKEQNEGVAYQWRYTLENQYGDDGMKNGSCPKRAESYYLNSTTRSLIVENFFPSSAYVENACKSNSGALLSIVDACFSVSRNRWANFLAVDFYKRSYGGGAFDAVDKLNKGLQCGANSNSSVCQDSQSSKGQTNGCASMQNWKTHLLLILLFFVLQFPLLTMLSL